MDRYWDRSPFAELPHLMSWLAGLGGFFVGIIIGAGIMTAVGFALVGFTAMWYLEALGEEISVVPLAGFISTAQWILGPALAYRALDTHSKYRMYVPEDEYMGFVVPALVAFLVTLATVSPRISLRIVQERILVMHPISDRVVFGLFGVGLISDYASDSFGSGLGLLLFLVGQLKYIGVIYAIILRWQYRWQMAAAVVLFTAISSARMGMFHDLILWSALIFTFFCYDLRLKILSKLMITVGLIGVLVGLQSVKADYRNLLQSSPEEAGLVTLVSSIGSAISGTREKKNDIDESVRLNQGWIISAVMAFTPSNEPFADGETVLSAITDSLLPRFLVDKREAIVSDNFRRFTGMDVGANTSFGISIIGEAWANFGEYGVALLVVWGLVFGGVLRLVSRQSTLFPTLALWIPMIFLHAVKAETELLVALNYLLKAGCFVAFVYTVAWRLFGLRI